jgi:hypothetical protein
MLVTLDLSLIAFIYLFEFLYKRLNFLMKQAPYAWIIEMLSFLMFYLRTRLHVANFQMLKNDKE